MLESFNISCQFSVKCFTGCQYVKGYCLRWPVLPLTVFADWPSLLQRRLHAGGWYFWSKTSPFGWTSQHVGSLYTTTSVWLPHHHCLEQFKGGFFTLAYLWFLWEHMLKSVQTSSFENIGKSVQQKKIHNLQHLAFLSPSTNAHNRTLAALTKSTEVRFHAS